ncbi:MAG: SUMF1/EgtB/PvdO family nonheme iron enzyme [Candidatus Binatia bacterium]
MSAERKLKVFLCHSSGDKPAVRDLYKRLQTDGFDPWLDEEDILPGHEWEREIPRAVRAADAIIVCLSHSSINREGYVQREISDALNVAEEKPPGTIFIIPLRLEDCEIHERLKKWQAGALFTERGYERLVQTLKIRASALGIAVATTPPLAPTITSSIGMELILISPREFLMGSEEGMDREKPVRRVQISQPFYMGKYPVTQSQWQVVMGNNPSRFTGDLNRPVEQVSWDDVQEFLRKLNERKKGTPYRLPTEAEWEYAARAGTTTRYCFGDDVERLQDYAWYDENSDNTTHPVGQLKPNAWGLYDVHGNVWEWVQDWFAEDYYRQRSNPDRDPRGPDSGEYRVLRGGSWNNEARDVRVGFRLWPEPGYRRGHLGFRCAQ